MQAAKPDEGDMLPQAGGGFDADQATRRHARGTPARGASRPLNTSAAQPAARRVTGPAPSRDNRAMPAPPRPERLRALIASLEDGLLERGAAARLLLLAALGGEHVLLIGPPGTAKSELARRLQHAFAGARWFEHLLTRFSVPEELFGPLSIKALEADRYERLTDGYLPTAGVAFLDEVFKANSAILNALLTLLNERVFDNGGTRAATPLVCVVGATNEVPGDETLAAFFDRFLLRVPVEPVSDAQFSALLQLPSREGAGGDAAAAITPAERDALIAARAAVHLPEAVIARLAEARQRCAELQIGVSDRRWRQVVGLLRTAAASAGHARIELTDLWWLPYALAHEAAQIAPLQDWLLHDALAVRALEAPWLTRAVEAFEKQLEIESTQQQDDGEAGKLALARAISGPASQEAGAPMRMVSVRLEEGLRRRYSPLHIAARVAQADEVLARAEAHHAPLAAHAAAMGTALDADLWMPPALAQEVRAGLAASLATLEALRARLRATREGFATLPVDEALAGHAPAPIALQA
jgi:MoxR-like ATPase